MIREVVAFAAGLVFAVGLGVGGMTDPARVLGFLDLGGPWDASLGLVMAGALAVHAIPARLGLRWSRPVLDTRFHLTALTDVDAPLVVGAALFGAGWALSGFCPGPGLVGAFAGRGEALLFTASMGVGMAAHAAARRVRRRSAVQVAAAPTDA